MAQAAAPQAIAVPGITQGKIKYYVIAKMEQTFNIRVANHYNIKGKYQNNIKAR